MTTKVNDMLHILYELGVKEEGTIFPFILKLSALLGKWTKLLIGLLRWAFLHIQK